MIPLHDHRTCMVLPSGAFAARVHLCDHNGRTLCGVQTSPAERWQIWHESQALEGDYQCECRRCWRALADAEGRDA